jgi:hypothetical protein
MAQSHLNTLSFLADHYDELASNGSADADWSKLRWTDVRLVEPVVYMSRYAAIYNATVRMKGSNGDLGTHDVQIMVREMF